ncbi:MAG: nucleotide exchange factor GrpE [Pirellula sp.]|jgi:molecular chaperone GrpE|nr:nucleotide exchange factor GrpE [Pirellula sp.]
MNSSSHPTEGHRDPTDDVNDAVFAEHSDLDSDPSDDSPEQLVDALEQQVADLRERELKAQAELENFRKRILRDTESQLKYAAMPLVRDLLDVVDNLHRATESASAAGGAEGLVEGVKLVQQQLSTVLAKHHCTPIESVGKPFDPNFHQAIAQQPSSQYASGVVMHETSVGFLMHDRVVRPAMVIVSTGPS